MRTFLRLTASLVVFAAYAAAIDPDLLKLAMPEARVLTGMNVSSVKGSLFGNFLLSRVSPTDHGFHRFIEATGFDPRRDLQEVLFATPGGNNHDKRLLLLKGTFDANRITELARSKGVDVTTYSGISIINAGRREPMSLAILDNAIAIAGDAQSVREAVDRRSASPALDANLVTKAEQLSSLQDAWFISTVPLAEVAANVPNENFSGMMKGDALSSIDQASGGVKFGPVVALNGEVLTRSAQDASSLVDVVRFLTGLAQLGGNDPRIAQFRALLNTLDVRAEENTVKLALSIPEEQLEQLILSAQRNASIRRPRVAPVR